MLSHYPPDQRRLSDRIIKISRLPQLNIRSLEGFFVHFKWKQKTQTQLCPGGITSSRVATVWIKNCKPEPQNFMHPVSLLMGLCTPFLYCILMFFSLSEIPYFVLQLWLLAYKMSHQCMCSLQNAKWTVPWREGQETEMLLGKEHEIGMDICALWVHWNTTQRNQINSELVTAPIFSR